MISRQLIDLEDALRSLGHAAPDHRRPGLSPDDLRTIIARHPVYDHSWIDETVETWWAWHNGTYREPGQPTDVSPDGLLALSSFSEALEGLASILDLWDGASDEQQMRTYFRDAIFSAPVIPLCCMIDGEWICLRKPSNDLSQPWELWGFATDSLWTEVARSTEPAAIRFDDYLHELVARLRQGDLEVGLGGWLISHPGQTRRTVNFL